LAISSLTSQKQELPTATPHNPITFLHLQNSDQDLKTSRPNNIVQIQDKQLPD